MTNSDKTTEELRALPADPAQVPEVERVDAAFGDVIFDSLGFIEVMVSNFLAV
jgi:hypothetical protein